MTVPTSALDAPTVRLTWPGYPPPDAYRVPPLPHPRTPAGSGVAGVPWGPPSGPLPVAVPIAPVHTAPVPSMPGPTMPGPAAPARRAPVAALAAAALAVGLLVGGGVAVYTGSGDAPVAVTWSGATVAG